MNVKQFIIENLERPFFVLLILDIYKYRRSEFQKVLMFCIAIQYRSPGIGIAVLLRKITNTQTIPAKLFQAKHVLLMRAFQIE